MNGSEKRVLVTGATGFIGKQLIRRLSGHRDVHITALSRNISNALNMFPPDVYGNVMVIKADDWENIKTVSPDIVIHLAALSTPRDDEAIIGPLIESNITYGVKLLNALSGGETLRLFINIGSFAEYRKSPDSKDYAYLYAATKGAFHPFMEYYSDKLKFKYITAVLYSVYGGDRTVKRIVDFIIDSMDSIEPVGMTPGHQALDFVHVDDVVSFLCHCICNEGRLTHKGVYHIGTGQSTSIRELVGMIENISGKKCNVKWGELSYRERDIMYARAPIAETIAQTGWSPQISLYSGVKNYLEQIYE